MYIFLKSLSKKPDFTTDFFKCAQDLTSQVFRISLRAVSYICSEAINSENTPALVSFFKLPRKSYKRAKIQTELDNFDGEIVRRIIHNFYDKGKYPTAFLILNAYREKNDYTESVR